MKMKTLYIIYLYKRRAGSLHGNNADGLVDVEVDDEDLSRVDEDQVMATRLVVDQLETLVQGDALILIIPEINNINNNV